MNFARSILPTLLCFAITAFTFVAAEHFHVDASHDEGCDTCQLMTDFAPAAIVAKTDSQDFPQNYAVLPVSEARALVIRQLSRDPPTPV